MLRRVWQIVHVPPCGDPEGARGARGEEQTELAGDAGEVEEVERAEVGCYLERWGLVGRGRREEGREDGRERERESRKMRKRE